MRLYGLRVWYIPHGTSGGWNVDNVDHVRGIGDVVQILRHRAEHARLLAFSIFDREVPA